MQEFENIQGEETVESSFGLFVGRCMPFTNAHNSIIQDIIRDDRIPIMVLGGKGKVDERHPLSFEDRVKVIKKVYPVSMIKFIGIEDQTNWTTWYDSVKDELINLDIKKEQITLYAHNKPEDNMDFEYRGKQYREESYTVMFTENGVGLKNIDTVTCENGNVIHATDVRNDEEIAKRNLDARVYRMLKDKFQWWK